MVIHQICSPYLYQFEETHQKTWRSVKKRIESKVPEKSTQKIYSHNIAEIFTEDEVETSADSLSDKTISIKTEKNGKAEINQCWEISNGKNSLYAYVAGTDLFIKQFLERNTSRSYAYRFNDKKFWCFLKILFGRGKIHIWLQSEEAVKLRELVYITFTFSRAVLIIKVFHQLMIFFNEVLLTSYCCARYFRHRKK